MNAIRSKRHYCGHCNEYLNKTVYYQHKRIYYDKSEKRWSSQQVFNCSPLVAFCPSVAVSTAQCCSAHISADTAAQFPDQDTSPNTEFETFNHQDFSESQPTHFDTEGEFTV